MLRYTALLIALSIQLVLMAACPSLAANGKENILILNSYHHGYKWTDDQVQGIISELKPASEHLKIYIEYMGTKWIGNSSYMERLRDLYRQKYKSIQFKLILATDNDALEFLLKNRDNVFGTIPVVFSGINWFNPAMLSGHKLYTGVNEDADIEKNIQLILKLHPDTKVIYVIADTTTTGKIVAKQLADITPVYKNRVRLELLNDDNVPSAPGGVVLLSTFQKDRHGLFLEYNEVASSLSKNLSMPLYGLWDFYLGHGIIGGMLTSGKAQGENAGKIALRILQGEPAESIPVIMQSPNRYMFDYNQLERLGIKHADIPSTALIINEPASFYKLNKGLVWGLAGGITFLSLLVIYLLLTIHHRRTAEKALVQSEDKYRTLVDNLTLGVYRSVGDKDAILVQANPSLARIFGYTSPEEMINSNIVELYASSEERMHFLEEIKQKGVVSNHEVLMKKRDGTPIWININSRAEFSGSHELLWIDGIIEDITETKKLEAQLRQAQKMEALGTLSGSIAHDFNNILTAIIGYVAIIQMKLEKQSPLFSYTDEIMKASERATSLTKSLLAFGRKQDISAKAVDANELIRNFEKFIMRIIGEDITLKITCSPEPLTIMADSGQLEQVLMNLATNARDAMPQGGTLSITTSPVELDEDYVSMHLPLKPGRHVQLSISDTGCGMDEATKQKIFEPFFTTKELGRGTGLGMSIIYGIIKQHNGEITVYSEPGKGTTFKIFLPLFEKSAEATAANVSPPPVGGHETILLVEDDEAVRTLEKSVLEQFGYKVLEAADGNTALQLFKRHSDEVSLLMLDVIMPGKNGKEVYDEVQILKPDVKVLFTSGYTADIIHSHGILEKQLNFLSKPAPPMEIARKIRSILDEPPEA